MRDARLRALICGMTADYLCDATKRAKQVDHPVVLVVGLFRMRRGVRETLCLGGIEKREKSKERSEADHE
jgi:hypothetical protein